jgi:HAD superfamily hydrolase (TIGR01509 family)
MTTSLRRERQVLLLDVMDTLVVDPFLEVFRTQLGGDIQAILRDKDDEAWPRFERGEIDEQTYFRTMFKDRRHVDGPAIVEGLRAAYRFMDGIEPLLHELSRTGVEMHLLSNYPVWSEILDDKLGLSRFAPWTFVSWRTGVRKPDPQAYARAMRALARPAHELLFVDDRQVNVDAARSVGLDGERFVDVHTLKKALKKRGLLS